MKEIDYFKIYILLKGYLKLMRFCVLQVYRFEPETRDLTLLTTLVNLSENPRVRFGLAHMGGCLVVIGGHQLGHSTREPVRSVCLDIASKLEVRDYSPMLPGEIVNTCVAAKLCTNILKLFND